MESCWNEDIGWEIFEDRRFIVRLSLLYKMQHGLVDVDSFFYYNKETVEHEVVEDSSRS